MSKKDINFFIKIIIAIFFIIILIEISFQYQSGHINTNKIDEYFLSSNSSKIEGKFAEEDFYTEYTWNPNDTFENICKDFGIRKIEDIEMLKTNKKSKTKITKIPVEKLPWQYSYILLAIIANKNKKGLNKR